MAMSLPVRSPVPAPPQRGDWERYKQRIAHLYLEENKPLREVADIMRIEHDFTATYVSAPPQEKATPEPPKPLLAERRLAMGPVSSFGETYFWSSSFCSDFKARS
jgi:hypothetical protein